jgi:hypothetical protein
MEITDEQVTSLMKQLDPESQELLAKIMLQISPNRAITIVKSWIDFYSEEDPIDIIIANTVAEIITKYGRALTNAAKEAGQNNIPFSGQDAFNICVDILQNVVNKMKEKQTEYDSLKH